KLAADDWPRPDRERRGAVRRPDAVLDQARHRHQGYGRDHSRPWRRARPLQQPAPGRAGGIPLCRLHRRLRPGRAGAGPFLMGWKLKPARDFGLSMAERIGSQERELGLIATATHWCWRRLTRRYLLIVHRLTVEGIEQLPEPPFLFIANHSSHLDA